MTMGQDDSFIPSLKLCYDEYMYVIKEQAAIAASSNALHHYMFVSVCIMYCLDLNGMVHIVSLIFYIWCAYYAIFVVRVLFVIKGHIATFMK